MRNENVTKPILLRKRKQKTESIIEAEAKEKIERKGAEIIEVIFSDIDVVAARYFIHLFRTMKMDIKNDSYEKVKHVVFVILYFFFFWKEIELIDYMPNSDEKMKCFLDAFVSYGIDVCMEYIE